MRAVPCLMYHHVSPIAGLVTVTPDVFEAQMAYVAQSGYRALTPDQFVDFLTGRSDVPRKSVLITFDDGYLDNYVYAYPILKRFGLRATIFIVTGWLGDGPTRPRIDTIANSDRPPHTPGHRDCKNAIARGEADSVMMRWSEIEAMEASGTVECHSHTHSHVRWDRTIPERTQRLERLTEDLHQSKEQLRIRLGRASRHLCWPQGYFDADYQSIASGMGFEAQYTTRKGVNRQGTDPSSIFRLVAKARSGYWFANRLWIYRKALRGQLYTRLRGK